MLQRLAPLRERLHHVRLGPPGRRALVGALVTLLVLLPFYLQLSLRAQEWLLREARVEVATKLASHGNALASALYRRLALLQSLRAYVRSEVERPGPEPGPAADQRFESFAAGLSVGTTGVTYFSVAPGGRLRNVYPLATNEDLLDADLLNDPCADLRANAWRAVATQEMAVGWLREGCRDSQRLAAHLAIYDRDALWGLVGMVLDVNPVLYEAGIKAQPSGLDLALRDHTGMVLIGPSYVFESDPVIHRIELPDGYWELAGIPTGGWLASIRRTLTAFQAAGLAIVALAVLLVGVIVTRQEYLAQVVRDRTAELVTVNRELQTELMERQRAEAALRDSEELYKSLVETSPDAVIMTDLQGYILSVSRQTADSHGYRNVDDLIGLNVVDLVAPAHRIRAREQLQHPSEEEQPRTTEYTLLRRDGTTFVGEVRSTLIRDAAGQPRAVLTTTRDVTERRRAEQSLQELAATLEDRVRQRTFEIQVLYELSQQIGFGLKDDELFGLTLQHAHRVVPYDVAGVLLVTGEHCDIFIRPARELTEHSERQLIECLVANHGRVSGQAVDAARIQVHYLHHAPAERVSSALSALGSVFQVPLVFSRRVMPNEAPSEIVDHGSAFQMPLIGSETREIVGLLVVAAEEVGAFNEDQMRLVYTMASQASAALQRMRALLAAQQERLESLVENLPEGVLLLDGDLKPLLVNPAARRYLAMLGGVVRDGALSQLGGKGLAPILRHADGRQPHELVTEGPPRRTFELVARPLIDGARIRSWVLVLRDVTEERSVQERMQQQARLAAVGQLAAGIAHDFNNLLTSILGYSELAATDPDLPEAFRDDMDVITRQGRRAADLVRQILDFSRKSISRQQTLDLAPFLRETVKLLQRTLPEHVSILLELNRDEDYTVRADVTQMQQAITNLAINARDAMPEGGTLTFALSRLQLQPGEEPPLAWMPPGHWVGLAVTDTGMGIPDEVMPHLFEPFFTTKGPSQGTGLGLAQVYGIVKQHNGFIGIGSQPGEGATVTIYLPAQVVPPSQEPPPVGRPHDLPRGSHETTILVVEDEDAVRQISARTLESLGYNVLSSCDGVEALSVYDRHPGRVDLVLMDLVMPNMGGRELLDALRERDPDLKVIVMSGYPLDVNLEEILSGNHIEWLPKPLRLGDLAACVHAILDGQGQGPNGQGDHREERPNGDSQEAGQRPLAEPANHSD
jgi:PAS domain S-box-containing protein